MQKFKKGDIKMSHPRCIIGVNNKKNTLTMMNTALKSPRSFQAEPVLRSIFKEAELEHRSIIKMFDLLGWGDLPEELKFTIKEDVKGYIDELNGEYSTNCSLVQRRRESVDFWVNSYLDETCTLNTAVKALKTTRL